jgi:hypothetical protein
LYGWVQNTKTLISQLLLSRFGQLKKILLIVYSFYHNNTEFFSCPQHGVLKRERSKISIFGAIYRQKWLSCSTILSGWK